ncbi:hypothetical protein ACV36Q_32735, partial [Pseudomonas aeruginosa]
LRPHQRVRAGIAYVPQGREIFPRLTVEENLLMGLSRFSARDARAVPDFIYELFPVLREMLAAGEVAAAALFHFAQDREQLVDEVRHRPGVPGAETGQSHQQVLFHRQPGEDFPSLRHVGDPGADPLVRPE